MSSMFGDRRSGQVMATAIGVDTRAAIVLFVTQKNAGAIIDRADRCLQQLNISAGLDACDG
jgi:hypothetical protein